MIEVVWEYQRFAVFQRDLTTRASLVRIEDAAQAASAKNEPLERAATRSIELGIHWLHEQ